MSNTTAELFNQDFALRQFSGNRTLLVSMLNKFIAQYANYQEKLDELMAQQAQDDLVRYVHTIKGISGNLGLESLYQASRSFETALSQEQVASEKHIFTSSLAVTLQHIQAFVDAAALDSPPTSAPAVSNSESVPSSNNEGIMLAKQQLTSALSQQQFISSSKLLDFLQRINLSPSDSEAVQKAINELDYATAIRYLK